MDKVLLKYSNNWGLERKRVERITKEVLKKFKFDFEVELGLVFLGKKKAKDLNIRYRKMNYVPQVLGFPYSKTVDPDGLTRLGDVVICTSKLKEEMKLVENKNVSMYEILEKWIKHGVNNLLK